MKFFELIGAEDISSGQCEPSDVLDELFPYDFAGPVGDRWPEATFGEFEDVDDAGNRTSSGEYTDFPFTMSPCQAMSMRAAKLLEPFFEGKFELLPIRSRQNDLVALNLYNVVDCVDLKQSRLDFRDSGFYHIRRFRFNSHALGHHCFVVPESPKFHIFISEEFVRVVEEAGLVGLAPKYVCTVNDDGTPLIEPDRRNIAYEGLSLHEIVPSSAPEAAEAQAILDRYHIHFDDSENTMWFPTALHVLPSFTSPEACAWLNEQIRTAEQNALAEKKEWIQIRKEIGAALYAIGEGFVDGIFPWEEDE